jgi:hypothetical protein
VVEENHTLLVTHQFVVEAVDRIVGNAADPPLVGLSEFPRIYVLGSSVNRGNSVPHR